MRTQASFLSVIAKPKNRQILSWVGGGIIAVATGAWAIVTYVWPAHDGVKAVCAQQGSVAGGRDASGNTIIYSGAAPGAGTRTTACVETDKK
jgi:hypothetical protein